MAFWRDVMGLEVTGSEPGFAFLVHRGARLGLGLTDHGGAVSGGFDHEQPGLDHVALAVDGPEVLDDWVAWLDAGGVTHSGAVRTDAGHHLNLRAPGGVAVELFVMSSETAAAFGLGGPSEGVAHGHGAAEAGRPWLRSGNRSCAVEGFPRRGGSVDRRSVGP